MTEAKQNIHDSGGFRVGDQVRVLPSWMSKDSRLGRVIRIDPGEPYPVIVWLDEFGKPTPVEQAGRMGLPTHAAELEKVDE